MTAPVVMNRSYAPILSSLCAICADLARSPEIVPHGETIYGDGLVCSAKCAYEDALNEWHADTPEHRQERVKALRRALDEDMFCIDEIDMVVDCCSADGVEHVAVGRGLISDWNADELTVENIGEDGEDARIEWSRLIDARAVMGPA